MGNAADIVKTLAHSRETDLDTLEKPLKKSLKPGSLSIGIPKANKYSETRIPLTPKAVQVLTARGLDVMVESGAGLGANFSDKEYSDAGAKIIHDHKEIYNAHMLIKMNPIDEDELPLLKANQIILSPIHLPKMNGKVLEGLVQKKVIALAFEYIKDEVKHFPIVHALSEIAGRASILLAGQYLNNQNGGNGVLMGGVTGVRPIKIVILGAGTVGESAARAAIGLGAEIQVFDNNIYKLRRLQNNLGQRCFTSILNPNILAEELKNTDVAIGGFHSKIARTPILVTEEMVQNMPEGSLVIDVSIDQGGVFETSEVTSLKEPTFEKYHVTHYCVPNICAIYPVTSSKAISNILLSMLLETIEYGGFEYALKFTKGLRKGVYAYKGKLTNQYLSHKFQQKYTDFELLMATGFGN